MRVERCDFVGTDEKPHEAVIKLLQDVGAGVDLDAEMLADVLETLTEALHEGRAKHCEMGGDDEFEIFVDK